MSRVFVGNIPLDADREAIKAKFELHGTVTGVMVLKGFAFVQYEKDSDARKAIAIENGKEFLGKKIDVKPAKQNTNNNARAPEKTPDELGAGDMDVEVEEDMNNPWGPDPWGVGARGRGNRGTQVSQMMSRGRGDFNRGGVNRGGGWGGGGGFRGGFNQQSNTNYQHDDSYLGGDGGQGEDIGEEYNEMSDMEKFNERLNNDVYEEDEGMSHQGSSWGDRGGFRGGRGARGAPAGDEVSLVKSMLSPSICTVSQPAYICHLILSILIRSSGGVSWGGAVGNSNWRGGGAAQWRGGGGGGVGGWNQTSHQGRGDWGATGTSSGGGGPMSGPMGGPPPIGGPFSQPPPSLQTSLPPEKVNDVEIICLGKTVRVYAEQVEERLKKMGLAVDVLFPNPDVPIGRVLGSIASRGVKYGACVGPESQADLTITLNVLQGEQEEHRNMPLDDAMTFVSRSLSAQVIEKTSKSPKKGVNHHPEDILSILGFLQDNRPLSVVEYDKLLRYLNSQRTAVLRAEYGDHIPPALAAPPLLEPAVRAKQEEVQGRVMSILNKTTKATPTKNSTPAPRAPGPLAPSLQAAIDSLVKTGPNLLSTFQSPSASSGTSKQGSQFDGYNAVKRRGDLIGDEEQRSEGASKPSPAKSQYQHQFNPTWGQAPPGNHSQAPPGKPEYPGTDQSRKDWRSTPPPSVTPGWQGRGQASYGGW